MFFLPGRSWGRLAGIAIAIWGLLCSCGPTRYAYFQPQRTSISYAQQPTIQTKALADTVLPVVTDSVTMFTTSARSSNAKIAGKTALRLSPDISQPSRHRNPDSYQNQRINRWFRSLPVGHVAPKTQLIDRNSRSRKNYPLVWVALGLGVLSAGAIFVVTGGTLMWILGITMPLTATLLGVASLTTIKRHPDQYRGKGWAMAAIMLGTGALGLALVALAALSVSETIHR